MKIQKIIKFIFTILLIMFTISTIASKTYAVTITNIAGADGVTWGGSKVGHFEIDGRIAFCIDHAKKSPTTGTEYGEGEVYNDSQVRKILYYGWGGPAQWDGFSGNQAKGIVITTMELNKHFNGNDRSYLADFEEFLDSQPDPRLSADFEDKNLNARVEGNKQVTNQISITGSDRVILKFNLPEDITLVCENNNWTHTGGGEVGVSAGDVIHFEAPLTRTGTWTSADIPNSVVFQSLIFTSSNVTYQRIAKAGDFIVDPGRTTNITINWVDTGSIEIHKKDSSTGQAISHTTFNVKGNGIDENITTDANGIARLDNIPLGRYEVTEIKSNTNYEIDTTVRILEVEAGKTTREEIGNKHTEGELEVLKVNALDESMKIAGVKFELYSKETNKVIASGVTNREGKVKFQNIRTGDYLLYEVETNEWYQLDTTRKNVTIRKNDTATMTVKNHPKMGYIAIEKYDQDYNDQKLEGAVFEIYNSKGQKVDTLTTNGQGIAKSKALPIYEIYTVKEIKAPANYHINTKETTIRFTSNENNVIKNAVYPEKRKTGKLKVYKVDEQNQKITLGNVKFDLYSYEFDRVVGTFFTNVDGEIFTEDVRVGKYAWIEKETNKWYDLAENIEVEVVWDTTTEKTIVNKLKQGRVKVVKVDKDNNEIVLEGVKFQVMDKNGNILETIVTNENGEAVTAEYPIRDFETLSLKEIETLAEYKLNNSVINVTLKANEAVIETVENEVKKGQIKVIKVDKDNNEVKLEGVVFEVLNEKGEVIQTIITDEKGEAITDRIPIRDEYTVREKETLQEYQLNEESVKIKLKEDEIKTLTFTNELKKAQIKVVKVDKENHDIKLKDVEFEVYNSKGELVDRITTDEKGEAITKELPVNDIYTLKEIKTNQWYQLDVSIINIDLTKYIDNYRDNIVEAITIENQIKQGQVKVIKVDRDNQQIKLEGVVFELLDEKGNVVDTLVTDKYGEAISTHLRINQKYTLKEVKTQEIYELNEELITIELEDNQVIDKTITNKLKKAQIKVIKVDKENQEIKLKDVVFEVYDSKGKLVDRIITDKNGEAITKELPVNDIYSLKETKTDKYYEMNEEAMLIDLTKYVDNYEENIVEETIIENQVKKASIKIIKVDGDTKVPLKDIIFEVYDEENQLIETIITDENGEAITKELPMNKHYILIEKETKKGYKLSDAKIEIELTEEEINSIKFENYKEKGKIKIVKTSSDGKLEGFTFRITGTSITGEKIEMTVTTGKDGIILIDDVLSGEYTIEEIRDEKYEATEPQTVIVKDGEVVEVNFYNKRIETKVPKTGDNRNFTALRIVFGISSALMLGIVIFEKMKNRKERE